MYPPKGSGRPVTREDEALVHVLHGGKYLEEPVLEKARKLQREKHPKRELADVLLQYKLIDKERLAVAQRLAKMAKPPPRKTVVDAPAPPTSVEPDSQALALS